MRARAAPERAGLSRAIRIVRRGRVVAAIGHALRSGICWIAAPAGYGKTTSVVDYLQKSPAPHVWHRVDEGDQDIASFFHRLGALVQPARAARDLPVFGPEYADQPAEFARRFFRAYFHKLKRARLIVIDDLHHGVEVPHFRLMLAMMLRELPENLRCVCISRTLPPDELTDLAFKGRLTVIDQTILQFSDSEARALVANRMRRRSTTVDVSAARGWAAGLALLADRAATGDLRAVKPLRESRESGATVFEALTRQLFATLPTEEQEALLTLSLLPEITLDLARDLTGSAAARNILVRLCQRQLLVTRGDTAKSVYHLHDLLRDFLQNRLTAHVEPRELAARRERAAACLHAAGYRDAAIDLALQARQWPLARRFIIERAEALIGQGRRATLIDWCDLLPDDERDAWVCYWLGVAHMADDAAAEVWLARAWSSFTAQNDRDGQCLTAARAVLSKSDSWRTHEGLAAWTERVIDLIDLDFPGLSDADRFVAWAGMLRAVDFAQNYRSDAPAVRRLTQRLLKRLAARAPSDTSNLRLTASLVLIDHAAATGQAEIFERAVDSVAEDLAGSDLSPWVLGDWLVNFGSATARYYTYARQGFPYTSPEDALRAAIAIGKQERLRGVEFGALYHLQLLMKMRGDFSEFETLVSRLAEIADSRYTTQVAVVADCQAAAHTVKGNHALAQAACDRFMAAIEAANEPPIERWPHFITKFQVLLGEGRATEAVAFLESVKSLFDGAVRRRTEACIGVARTLDARWSDSPDYPTELGVCMTGLRQRGWPAILINLPRHLAELCADALERGFEVEFCRELIERRRLAPPDRRPAEWPWRVRIHVLGAFRLERDAAPLDLGVKPPTRSLDLLRRLAIANGQTLSLDDVYESLWPDADGDQAKAACEQALHRLRRLLGPTDFVSQREGKLRLLRDRVWVDLDAWQIDRDRALRMHSSEAALDELDRIFWRFPGPLFQGVSEKVWSLPAAERVRSELIELASRLGGHWDARGAHEKARTFYARALEFYPASERCYEALLRSRLAQSDIAGALEDYHRCERILRMTRHTGPSLALRAIIAPHLARVSDT